jgi:hypothetical protein
VAAAVQVVQIYLLLLAVLVDYMVAAAVQEAQLKQTV